MNIPNKFEKFTTKASKKRSVSTSIDSQSQDSKFWFNKKPIHLQFTSLQAARNQVKLKKNYSFSSLQEARYKFKAQKTANYSQNVLENNIISTESDLHDNYQRNGVDARKYCKEEGLISKMSSTSKSKSLSSLDKENFDVDSDSSFYLAPSNACESIEEDDFMSYYSDSSFYSCISQYSVNNPSEDFVISSQKSSANENFDKGNIKLVKKNIKHRVSLGMRSHKHSIEFYSDSKENLKRKINDDYEVSYKSKRFRFSSGEFSNHSDLHRIDIVK